MERGSRENVLDVMNISLSKCINNVLVFRVKPIQGPIDKLVLILDSSPSMNGRKLYVAKRLGERLIRLAESLNVGKVHVSAFCGRLHELGSGRPEEALELLESVKTCVGTNLAEAFNIAYSEGKNTGVILITDGRPSVGPKSPEGILARLSKEPRPKSINERRVVVTLLGEDANQELAKKIVEALGGFVYKVLVPEARDAAFIALYAGLADAIPNKIAIGIPAWANVKVFDHDYHKKNGEWIEIDVLDSALSSRTIAIAVESNLLECGEDIVLPLTVTTLRLVDHEIVEKETSQRFVEVKFKPIYRKIEKPD